jgi:S-disulfanyl-L-cysteine oxidoreductase SoxD
MKWSGVVALCAIAGVARAQSVKGAATQAAAVSPPGASDSSTLSGVYTEAQAARGKNVYAGNCRSCHSPQSHTGETFATWWRGKRLSDLFTFVSTRMPKNDPGSLAPEDAADVVAYLLQMNAMPPGTHELVAAADSLQPYRIEMKQRAKTAKRKKP